MQPEFHICQKNECSVIITGLSKDKQLYLGDSTTTQPYNKFKYADTATVNILQLNTTTESKITTHNISHHCSELDESRIKFKQDGYYKIYHIILPTVECLSRITESDPEFLQYYSNIYAVYEDQVVKLIEGKWEVVDLNELIEVNTYKTTISIAIKELFSTCYIWECYIDIVKNLLDSQIKCPSDDIKQLTFNRDVVWMTINVIDYYLRNSQFYEAQRILELIEGCNGFCSGNSNNSNSNKRGGCGCGR